MCTFRRPSVAEALMSLGRQILPDGTSMRIVVIDNDAEPTARELVTAVAKSLPVAVDYRHAPAFNISIARNAGLAMAEADLVAFFDDDQLAAPDWLVQLAECLDATGADGAFGPVRAIYPEDAPDWIRRRDYHSAAPAPGEEIMTGYCGNAILRWRGAPWYGLRFDPARGRSGGEDTDFFFRVHAMGARFAFAADALATEPVAPERLSFAWLRRRKFRMGQSYASSAVGPRASARLFLTAAGKAGFCAAAAMALAPNGDARRFWLLRGALHAGVCAGCVADVFDRRT
jgi:succinoglycan biosynthesis protein ExoM